MQEGAQPIKAPQNATTLSCTSHSFQIIWEILFIRQEGASFYRFKKARLFNMTLGIAIIVYRKFLYFLRIILM